MVGGNVTRFGIQSFKTDGALHCECLANAGSNEVNIRCWDERGFLLSKAQQRKIETILQSEDFSRLPSKDFGQHRYVSGLEEEYVKKLAEIYREHVKTVPVAVLDTGSGDLTFLVKEFLRELNCEIVDPAAKSKKRPFLFIKLGKNGWELLDENQRTLNDDQLWGLRMLAARLRNKDRIAIPLNISQMMERIAENTKQHIQRTKLESSMWMEVAAELGNNYHDPKGEIDFFPHIEPLVSIGEILSVLSSTDKPASQVCPKIKTYRSEKATLCPWDAKGWVMRNLINSADPSTTQFIDGIKKFTDSGWVLVIPDGDEPVFKIYSEAESKEEAERLTNYYCEKIEKLLQECSIY